MDGKLSFVEKVAKVQTELNVPKGQQNTFGKYKYRSAEDILEKVKPICASNGLTLTLTDKPLLIGERYYIEATATLTDGEEKTFVNGYAREPQVKKGMDESQITGTASSYARKYALNGLFLIDDTKDADTDEYKNTQNSTKSISKNKQDNLKGNFKKIANLRRISESSVEASFLSLVEFSGNVEDLDENIYLKLMQATADNIKKIENEQLNDSVVS